MNKIILFILLALQLIGEEIEQKKRFFYGSFSLAPGGGVSIRNRHSAKGTALDIKLGVTAAPNFDAAGIMPILSADYNWMKFSKKDKEISPYSSCGIGVAYFIPYIPLRAGIEFENGFIDIGAKMVLGFLPFPEARGGINF